jgi:hypothetical protein
LADPTAAIIERLDMWVSKPFYESLPYLYLVVGVLALVAAMYVNYWYWPTICFSVGLFGLVAGLVVLLKRRDHRDPDQGARQKREL